MSRDETTLLDIVQACRRVTEFLADSDSVTFFNDHKTQSAVVHQLLVLGEAVKRLSPVFREENDGIPWQLIAGMRDNLIHEYDSIDLDEVWNTATPDIPGLVRQLEPLLPAAS